jgi:hypothetical protein
MAAKINGFITFVPVGVSRFARRLNFGGQRPIALFNHNRLAVSIMNGKPKGTPGAGRAPSLFATAAGACGGVTAKNSII